MKGVAFVAKRGGSGKTSLAHALALGAAWKGVPAYFMHTDDREPLSVSGRPYPYYDARDPDTLATLSKAALNNDGLFIVDSGGNRPEFDRYIVQTMDLVLVPFKPDAEDVATNLEHMRQLEDMGADNVKAVINAYPSHPNERRYVDPFFDPIPADKILTHVPEVKAIRTLRMSDNPSFTTPVTRVNNLARAFYLDVMAELETMEQRRAA